MRIMKKYIVIIISFVSLLLFFCDSSSPQGKPIHLSIYPPGSGTIERDPDKESYEYGEQVTLTAVAFTGYSFFRWYGNADTTAQSIIVEFNDTKQSYTAAFTGTVLGDNVAFIASYPDSSVSFGEDALFNFGLNLSSNKTYTVSAAGDSFDVVIFGYQCEGDALGVQAGIRFDRPAEITQWNISITEDDKDSVVLDTLLNYTVVWSNFS